MGGNHTFKKRRKKNRSYGGTPIDIMRKRSAEKDEDARISARGLYTRESRAMAIPKGLGEINDFAFKWDSKPISLATEEQIASKVVRKGEFGWLDENRVEQIAKLVEDTEMNLDQALSLRSALLQQKTVYTHRRLQSRSRALTQLYKDGVSVVDLSKRFDFPPMNIFRTILKEMGWSKSRIKESLRKPSKMKEREREEFEAAEAADRVSNVDQSETHERADLFEEILADWFEERGVRIRRQTEMVSEQMSEHGRPVRTPDLLFLDAVKINGEPVTWMDAKHFYGADVDFQRKKVAKQVDRYVEEWGQGAVVFRHGFCANVHISGSVLLDSSPLDLSRLIGDG